MKIRELAAAAAALPVVALAARDSLLDLISANSGCESVMVSFDGSLSEAVTYKELPSNSCKVCSPLGATAYHLLASDQGAQRGPFEAVVDADREVDCTKSLAFATSTSLGKVYSTPLKQAGSFTCLASWFGVFPDDSSWTESFTISFASLVCSATARRRRAATLAWWARRCA